MLENDLFKLFIFYKYDGLLVCASFPQKRFFPESVEHAWY